MPYVDTKTAHTRPYYRPEEIERDEQPDHHSEPELCGEPAYEKQDRARIKSWKRGEWNFLGIRARVQFYIPHPYGPHSASVHALTTPGLWGIESDSGDEYLDEVYEEQKADLIELLHRCGIRPADEPEPERASLYPIVIISSDGPEVRNFTSRAGQDAGMIEEARAQLGPEGFTPLDDDEQPDWETIDARTAEVMLDDYTGNARKVQVWRLDAAPVDG